MCILLNSSAVAFVRGRRRAVLPIDAKTIRYDVVFVAIALLAQAQVVEGGWGDPRTNLESTAEDSIRSMVSKAMPTILDGAESWMREQDCVSCHRVANAAWAVNRAHALGFDVPAEKASQINTWATDWRNLVAPDRRPDAIKNEALSNECDTVAQLLLGRNKEENSVWAKTYQAALVDAQQTDGSWAPTGQLPSQKRELLETRQVTTHWVLIALASEAAHAPGEELAVKRAIEWLDSDFRGESTEWWATRLIATKMVGTQQNAVRYRETLLKSQRADGGWGWLTQDESDALGTGIALYALGLAGLSINEIQFSAR